MMKAWHWTSVVYRARRCALWESRPDADGGNDGRQALCIFLAFHASVEVEVMKVDDNFSLLSSQNSLTDWRSH